VGGELYSCEKKAENFAREKDKDRQRGTFPTRFDKTPGLKIAIRRLQQGMEGRGGTGGGSRLGFKKERWDMKLGAKVGGRMEKKEHRTKKSACGPKKSEKGRGPPNKRQREKKKEL